MLKVFIGYDDRQPAAYNVLQHSINKFTSWPIMISALKLETLPIKRRGLTPFTFSRFLVPYLCDYEGWALFLDADILLLDDISRLFDLADDNYAVMVSKNEHRFEWASVILFNCAHEANKKLTPEYIESADGLHQIRWCDENLVGDLPREWNHLVGYDKPRKDAKLVHYTQGTPCLDKTSVCEYSELWHEINKEMNYSCKWDELMANSVHAVEINGKKLPKFMFDLEKGVPVPEYLDIVKKHIFG